MGTSTLLQFYVFLIAVPSLVFSAWIYFDRQDKQADPTTGQGIGSFGPLTGAVLFLGAGLCLGWLGWILAYLSYRSSFVSEGNAPSAGDAAQALLKYRQQFEQVSEHSQKEAVLTSVD